jgi:hypothetical protein
MMAAAPNGWAADAGRALGLRVHRAATSGASGTRPGICANPATGPATAPAGAVTVNPSVVGDLQTLTNAKPAGTTFWLAPGVHTLGSSAGAQVVPLNNDVYLGAPGAIIDGQGVNQWAFAQHAGGVTIQYLTIRNFNTPQNQGVVNHDSGKGWVIADDVITGNHGAAMMAGAGQQILRNCLSSNGQYGINAYQSGDGITNLLVSGNEIVGNDTDNWEVTQPGCGCSGGVKFWAVNGATVANNWVHANRSVGLWADTDNNDFLIQNNWIEDNVAEAVIYETSYNLRLTANTIARNLLTKGAARAAAGDAFPYAAVYVSNSGGDSRVPARTAEIEISQNLLQNNWSGITGWQDANRFCNSPANTSTGYCTLVGGGASTRTCVQPGIASAPLYGNCQWKTQNLDIHDNTFDFDSGAAGCTNALCGWMALLSDLGTYPSWSPYLGTVVEQAITFDQNNHWHNNTYSGPWRFMSHDNGTVLTQAAWTAAPWSQDAGSTFAATTPANILDPATAGGEGGIGHWAPWYKATVQDTSADPHSGTGAIQVNVTASYGWGIQLNNYPGFRVAPGAVTVSFWALAGTAAAAGSPVSLTVVWTGPNGQTGTTLTSPALTGNWQQATTSLQVPSGATAAFLTVNGSQPGGAAVVLDDIYVGS